MVLANDLPEDAMSHRMLAFAALLAISATACGTRSYRYAPVKTTGADLVGQPAAELPFPPDSPQGHVRLATLGLAGGTAESPRSIHVRIVATNRGPETWVIEKSEQELAVAVGAGRRTTVVRANAELPRGAPARVEAPPGATATVDLYFPLPAGARDASDVPAFDALWSVHSGSRAFTTRTPFERFLASSTAHVPAAAYPYTPRTERERPPGTPDSRWPADDPTLVPDPVPRPALP
jgi:hypothetical protein